MSAAANTPPRLWLHAADEGAGAALSVLARHLAKTPSGPICVQTGPGGDGLGQVAAVDALLREHAPLALVVAGQPLPRVLIERAKVHGLGRFLVDAPRPAERGGWLFWPGAGTGTGRLLRQFTQIHARDRRAAEALARRAGGGVAVQATGALARHLPAPPCNRAELEALRASLGGRPAWFARALPLSEAEAAFRAHVHALRLAHRLLLIVSPADAADSAALADCAAGMGITTAQRSRDDELGETTQLFIADDGDDPGLFLRLAQICYLGGGLSPGAPTPAPVAAAALGAALIHGPHGSAADRPLLERLDRAGAARRIGTGAELGPAVGHFLQPETLALAALRAWEIASEGSDATERLAQALLEWCRREALPPGAGGAGGKA